MDETVFCFKTSEGNMRSFQGLTTEGMPRAVSASARGWKSRAPYRNPGTITAACSAVKLRGEGFRLGGDLETQLHA